MTQPEFREAEHQPPAVDPDAERLQQAEREELTRRLLLAERELEQTRETLEKERIAYRRLGMAWTLAKSAIMESHGKTIGNLIRIGIEEQVEREERARITEESR